MAKPTGKVLWALKKLVGTAVQQLREYPTFHEAMEALKNFPGEWTHDWGAERVGKGVAFVDAVWIPNEAAADS